MLSPWIYGLSEENARAAERLHRERYPQRDIPDHWMFANFYNNCVNMDHYDVIGIVRVGHSIQHILFHAWTECVGYRLKESEYRVGSSHSGFTLTMPITSK
ncbi:hypothetical protein TNCV_835911 [Trichonephila clavipes]|nr:hypothetical protein TNCV_835911 [Trichonephila clavipes]